LKTPSKSWRSGNPNTEIEIIIEEMHYWKDRQKLKNQIIKFYASISPNFYQKKDFFEIENIIFNAKSSPSNNVLEFLKYLTINVILIEIYKNLLSYHKFHIHW